MSATISTTLRGHSGATLELIQSATGDPLVLKTGPSVSRNVCRMQTLEGIIAQPSITSWDDDNGLIMEYIAGPKPYEAIVDNRSAHRFVTAVTTTLGTLANYWVTDPAKDYTGVYETRLEAAPWLPGPLGALMDRLPRVLPSTQYHGDLTLDNIIWDVDRRQYCFLDAMESDFDSWVFDIARLGMDLRCGWYVHRGAPAIENFLLARVHKAFCTFSNYYFNRNLIIINLLRIWPYASKVDREWLAEAMSRLWWEETGA